MIPAAVQAFAQAHSETATSPMGKVLALADYLRENGRYSNGGGRAERDHRGPRRRQAHLVP